MKQKKLDNFLKPKDVHVSKQETKATDHDEDLKKAIELSKKVFQEETERKSLKDLDHNKEVCQVMMHIATNKPTKMFSVCPRIC